MTNCDRGPSFMSCDGSGIVPAPTLTGATGVPGAGAGLIKSRISRTPSGVRLSVTTPKRIGPEPTLEPRTLLRFSNRFDVAARSLNLIFFG